MNDQPGTEAIEVAEPVETIEVPVLRVLRREQCDSLSGRSRIGYEICCNEAGVPFVRVAHNSGKGLFSDQPVPVELIEELLSGASAAITSAYVQQKLYPMRSANCGGFAVAWMLNEGILKLSDSSLRSYEPQDRGEFYSGITALMEAGVALDVAAEPGRKNLWLEPASATHEVAKKKAGGKASGKGLKSKKT